MKGAYFIPGKDKWGAQIKVNGEKQYLGLYDTEAEAHAAYIAAVRTMHPTVIAARMRANQRRYEETEKQQLERCETVLARETQQRLSGITTVRCQCGGVLCRGHLAEHHCPYFHMESAA